MVVVIAALVLLLQGNAQWAGYGEPVYPERLRSDAELLRDAIHRTHPDPYRWLARGELDAAFDALIDSLRVPLTVDRYMARLMPVLKRIGDSHLRITLDAGLRDRVLRSSAQLPFTVRLLEEGLFIKEELTGFRSFAPGARILSINGISADRIVRDLGGWVCADGANETYVAHAVEQDFGWLFLLTYGAASRYMVETESLQRARSEVLVHGLLADEIERSRKPLGAVLHPWGSTLDAESGTLWLSLSTLDPEALRASDQKPRVFIDAVIKEAHAVSAKALVLDLRGAGGRELGMAELLFAAIAREPFRMVQGITVRATQPHALPGAVEVPTDFVASIDRSYMPPQNGMAALRPDDPRLALVAPSKKTFTGKVYVVCDGGTRDAAAVLAMLAARSGRARLVGEELGTNAHSFTGGRTASVRLPNSGLRIEIPLLRYIPEGASDAPVDHGERPRYPAAQQPSSLANGRDAIRSALIALINETR
jgi:hypothetical protein